jgi:hypothetical protein
VKSYEKYGNNPSLITKKDMDNMEERQVEE